MKKTKLYLIAITLIVIAASCKKTDTGNTATTPVITTGVYELNQGDYPTPNLTTLTFYDFSTAKTLPDIFDTANAFKLGDTGSDFIIYGGKMYIAMNVSSYVAVVNPLTAKLIDTVSFITGGNAKSPENIIGYGNKVFVSCNDGFVAVIDTTTLAITNTITVGTNPAQMAIYGSNLYISNTGGYGNYDSTISVINLNTLTETTQIKVGLNPGYIAADNSGNIYVACTGDYANVAPSLVKVNTSTNDVVITSPDTVGIIRYYNNYLYTTGGGQGGTNISVLNPTDLSVVKSNFISDGTIVQLPYGLDIDNSTGDVYVGDAINYSASTGQVFCFDKNGNKKFSFATPTAFPIKTVLLQQ
jgi:YVTN family beta-propeller protein